MRLNKQGIEFALAERRMSKGELARRLGITPGTLSNKINKRGRCSPSSAGRMAEALGVPVSAIAGPEETETTGDTK